MITNKKTAFLQQKTPLLQSNPKLYKTNQGRFEIT
jgi:hypothetical protein